MGFESIDVQCELAYEASVELALASALDRHRALDAMADALWAHRRDVIGANEQDVARGRANGLSVSLIDRLMLNEARMSGIVASIRQIAGLRDPLGEVIGGWVCENGLKIEKIRVPLGVIAMIYEARPNVTADAIALGVKTGNAVVLRGSASAYQSNLAIATIMTQAMRECGLNPDAMQLLSDLSHEGVYHLVSLREYISVAIPRGGATLINEIVARATVPTIETGVGNCHIFVDESANLDDAIEIILNAKVQRPSVCNSCETVLVHQSVAASFLPLLGVALGNASVRIRGCERTARFVTCEAALELDWETEYLDLILAIKVVDSCADAIAHIARYGTRHSEAILSSNLGHINLFKQRVDAAAVLVNASTRFVDGGEFGFGAELGISTQKLHARGPMGLPELTTYKYIVEGNGHIRS